MRVVSFGPRRALAALAVVLGTGAALRAPAQILAARPRSAPTPIALLPAAPALALRVDLDALEAMAAHAAAHGPRALQLGLGLLRGLGQAVAFDPTLAASWAANGFDPTQPLLLSLDGPPLAVAARAKVPPAAAVPWHLRLIAPMADAGNARAAVTRVAAGVASLVDLRAEGSAEPAAALLGASPALAEDAVEGLRNRGAILVGRIPLVQGVLIAHVRGTAMVFDVILGAEALDWSRDRAFVLALLRDPPRRSPRPMAEVAAALAAAGVSAWIDAIGALDAAIALSTGAAGGGEADLTRRCRDVRELATDGPFSGLAIQIAPTPRSITATWQLRPAFGLASFLEISDDGLTALPRDGVALAAALRLRALGALRALPRPAALKDDPILAVRTSAGCSPHVAPWLWAFGWPQWAAMWLDALASLEPEVARVIDGVGNVALAVQSMERRDFDGVVAAEAAFSDDAFALVTRGVEAMFGGRREQDGLTRWGKGALRPFAPSGGARRRLGIGFGDASVDWYLGRGDGPAAAGVIGEVSVSGARLAALAWPGVEGIRDILPLLPALRAELVLEGDTLRLRGAAEP